MGSPIHWCQFLEPYLHFGNPSSQFLMVVNLECLLVQLQGFLHLALLRQKFCLLHQLVEANLSIPVMLQL